MDTAKIQSELSSFVQGTYPAMTVRVEQVQTSEEHLAIFFIDPSFRDLYPQQRYHKLSGSQWFELAPGENGRNRESDADRPQ